MRKLLLLLAALPAFSRRAAGRRSRPPWWSRVHQGRSPHPTACKRLRSEGRQDHLCGSRRRAREVHHRANEDAGPQGTLRVSGARGAAHMHPTAVGQRGNDAESRRNAHPKDAFLAKVAELGEGGKVGRSRVTGRGWIETFWTPPVSPHALDLEDRPPQPNNLRRCCSSAPTVMHPSPTRTPCASRSSLRRPRYLLADRYTWTAMA